MKSFLCRSIAVLVVCTLLVGCAGPAATPAGKPTTAPQGKASSELNIKVPTSGTVTERVRQLWATTKPIIQADAAANLTDAQYQARRNPLYTAWVELQIANTNDKSPSDKISQLIPRILELIDHVYGFPGSPEASRVQERQNTSRTAALISDCDEQISALP